jgi:hydroxyacylglutathione hydrolase
MIFKKIKSGVVSHLSYFIGSDNEAIVVDPRRDCQIYVDFAQKENMNIRYIFETHRNEDYVIGSLELASLTGAEIYHGSWPEFKYGKVVEDSQEFHIGKLKVTAIHTPGHTPGDFSYAITDKASGEKPVLVCTGDTLFVNDIGRTDFGGSENIKAWSENLYDSIFNKLLPLGDYVIICPAHGSGSVCGGGIAERELSTLGLERLMNPILQKSRAEFIEHKMGEHHEYAPYFKLMEKYNVEGAPFVGYGPNPIAMKPNEFMEGVNQGAIVVDTRPPPAFGAGHIEGSYNIALKRLGLGGWVLPYDKPILLVLGDLNHLDYVARSLIQIGYDNIAGYLVPSIASWYKEVHPIQKLNLMTVVDLKEKIDIGEDMLVLDVRSKDEYIEGHIEGSLNIYVGLLEGRLNEVPNNKPVAVVCKSGTRSSFASSILLRAKRENIHNVLGGMDSWMKAGYPVTG